MPAPPVGPFVSAVPRLCLLARPRFSPARALGHLRHVYSPAITAASSARGLRLLEPGTLETDRTGSIVRIRNHRGHVARTPWRLPAP